MTQWHPRFTVGDTVRSVFNHRLGLVRDVFEREYFGPPQYAVVFDGVPGWTPQEEPWLMSAPRIIPH